MCVRSRTEAGAKRTKAAAIESRSTSSSGGYYIYYTYIYLFVAEKSLTNGLYCRVALWDNHWPPMVLQ